MNMLLEKDNVGRFMHHQVTQAAYDLQGRLGIWKDFTFMDYVSLTPHQKDLVDCEAGHQQYCKKSGVDGRGGATQALDNLMI